MPPSQPQTDQQPWLKITYLCPLALLEPAADLLGVLSGAGVEQSPETESGALISGFFQVSATGTSEQILAQVAGQMTELFALYGITPEPPIITLLADEDWATSWQQYFKPFEIVPGLIIKPSWEDCILEPGQRIIELDPGMAFGTGQHASTRMALDLIRVCLANKPVASALDVGTGTGILAMAAVLFGAGHAVALDNDPDAVKVAQENVANNRLAGQIETSTTSVETITGVFELVCANIIHDVLVEMAPILTKLTSAGGHLVLAGILGGEQESNIVRVYEQLGCHLVDRQHQDEWAALLLKKLQ